MGHVLPTTRALAKIRPKLAKIRQLMLLGFHQASATENMNTEARNSTDVCLTVYNLFRLWIRFDSSILLNSILLNEKIVRFS